VVVSRLWTEKLYVYLVLILCMLVYDNYSTSQYILKKD